MKILLSAAISILALTGCSSVKPPTASFSALSAAEKAEEGAASAKTALEEDFQRALEVCDAQMLGLRESFYGSGKAQISIATVGIIAGSIIVPALAAKAAVAKSAIAGWGGVAGAANAAQYTLQQNGVSGSQIGLVYEATRASITSASEAYSKATRNADRIVAINKLSIACRFPQLPAVEAPKPTPAASAAGLAPSVLLAVIATGGRWERGVVFRES